MVLWIIFGVILLIGIICLVLCLGFDIDIAAVICGICFLACFVIFIYQAMDHAQNKPDEKYDVCSLTTSTQNKEESAGLFVLGVGAYNSQSKKDTNYYFYKKEKQGGWKLTKVDAYDVVIFEDEDKKPYYVEVNKNKKDYDELHLPKNTIKKDIDKIKLENIVK